MFIDTHCHISKEDSNFNSVMDSLKDNYAIISASDKKSIKEVIELVNEYPNLYGVIGLHPECIEDLDSSFNLIEDSLKDKKIVGIGEIGLDYHYECNKSLQKKCFIKQIELAKKYNLPIVIHSRDSALDTIEILKNYPDIKKVMHCYSYSAEFARELIKLNVKFGIGGVVTFKNGKKLQEVVENYDISNFLLETDSPYLSPEPLRGTTNVPSNVLIVAEAIGKLKDISKSDVLSATLNNAKELFDLDI